MKSIKQKRSKSKRLGRPEMRGLASFLTEELDTKVELIRSLVPLGLMAVNDMLQREVVALAGHWYQRNSTYVRHGSNPGSVKLGGQRHAVRVPRVRSRDGAEAPLPGAIGLSKSSISRHAIKASAVKLKAFQERDLSEQDVVALFMDGKTFAEDSMVIALGVTLDGDKVPLGFVQTGTENGKVLTVFLKELQERGLRVEQGLLVVIDGANGLKSAEEMEQHFKKIVDPMRRERQQRTHYDGLQSPTAAMAVAAVHKVAVLLQALLGKHRWLAGDSFSLADATAAPYITRLRNLGLAAIWSGLGAAFGPVILCSLFWRGVTLAGAVAGILGGFLTTIIWVVFLKAHMFNMYEMVPAFSVGMLLIIAVSLATNRPGSLLKQASR